MVLLDLLQITTDTAAQDTAAQGSSAAESLSVLELILKGGLFVMIPLLILSVVTVYIFIERFLTIRKASKDPDDFMESIKSKVLEGDIQSAKTLCASENTPVARMIEKGLQRIGNTLKNIEASIENVGKIEIYRLEKNLAILATISGAAPMIGFFGTVTGMIKVFMSIAQEEGTVSPKLLSSGIYEALITTASGLFVGILSYIAYNYLSTQIQKIIYKMEYTSIGFIDLLQEPR